ncbi:MAG TPA: HDIG domain-containing protein, partial [Candidatus Woesebacteria bacterium]|nr:HDIG domain-containing protein [Candidatus Woesebacteria bacterium]
AGFEGFLVGGATRDLLIQAFWRGQTQQNTSPPLQSFREIVDYDFTTNATPNQIQALFPESYYTNEYGMVGVPYQHLCQLIKDNGLILPPESIASRTQLLHQPKNTRIIDLARASKVHRSLLSNAKVARSKQETGSSIQPPPFEITTYRCDGVYSDCRRPDNISWGKNIDQDLERRDFSVNAMAIDIKTSVLEALYLSNNQLPSLINLGPNDYQLIDHHQGIIDLAQKNIRTVRDPHERFAEDALRLLRAVRLACQLEFVIEPNTFAAIRDHAKQLQCVSWERISSEFMKILASSNPAWGINLLDQSGLLPIILPELIEAKGIEQGGHHDSDVWTHSLESLQLCPSNDPIVRLAALLHDIGKPRTRAVSNGSITFYQHEIVSSRIADKVATRLKFSNQQREKLFQLVRYHMFHYQPHDTDAAIRRMIKRVGLEYIDDILDLREGDRLGSGARRTSWRLEELKQRIVDQLNQPLDTTDLAINGHDLIQHFSLKPGKMIGLILNHLLEMVLEDPTCNTPTQLFEKAKQYLQEQQS